VVVFTTGRGTPTGFPFVPVIKVTGNSFTYNKMEEHIDINTGTIISENVGIQTKGQEMFEFMIAVSSGQKTKAEILKHDELFCITRV
jgi:altronate dehydratase large subunit